MWYGKVRRYPGSVLPWILCAAYIILCKELVSESEESSAVHRSLSRALFAFTRSEWVSERVSEWVTMNSNLSVEEVLQRHTVHELRDLIAQLESECGGKQTELQQMVSKWVSEWVSARSL